MKRYFSFAALIAICSALDVEPTMTSLGVAQPGAVPTMSQLRFEANAGQWDERVKFLARNGAATFFVIDDAMMIRARSSLVTIKLAGTRPSVPRGERQLVTRTNYLRGNDPSKWRTNVPSFAQVRTNAVPGIDLVWHAGNGGLEYDLEVAPDADATSLVMELEGADSINVASDGSLEIATAAGTLVQRPARVIQKGHELRARYVPVDASHVRFVLEGYERGVAMLIDPVLAYSTYLGGSAGDDTEQGNGIAVDASGNAYVTGYMSWTDFPLHDPLQATAGGGNDAFVSKFDPTGTTLVYSTYLGGSSNDEGNAIAVDASGNAYVGGATSSTDFPTKSPLQAANAGSDDAFVAVLNATGSALVYSTYLGGASDDECNAIAVDTSSNVYVAGVTDSTNFPTHSPFQSAKAGFDSDAFVAKINAAGSSLLYSTYLGGGDQQDFAQGIAVDATGHAYVTGTTVSTNFPVKNAYQATNPGGGEGVSAFVTKLDPSGSSLTYSTYLGGGLDFGQAIAIDGAGNAYVTGVTSSSQFPMVNAFQTTGGNPNTAFVTKLDATGSSLIYSTYLGNYNGGYGIAVDGNGDAYVTGFTQASSIPLENAFQNTNAGSNDVFVSALSANGSALLYSTYLGGTNDDYAYAIALDSSGSAYVTGSTGSHDFPTVTPFQSTNTNDTSNAFVAKIANPNFPNGAPCTPGGCASTNCVDGVCCDTACTDQCAACDVAGHVGTCSPVTGPPHGARPTCADAGTGVCALTCGGADPTQCSFPTATTLCSATCKGAIETDSFCDGIGSCGDVVARGCDNFVCDADAGTCKSSCVADTDCVTGFTCEDGGCNAPTTCIDQRVEQPANGPSRDCAPYKCANGCKTSCASSDDCVAPATCSGGQCIPPAPATSGCNCNTANASPPRTALLTLAVATILMRRRRRCLSC